MLSNVDVCFPPIHTASMSKVLGVVVTGLLTCLGNLACSDSAPQGAPMVTAGTGPSQPVGPQCLIGQACKCSGGLKGTTACVDGKETCACEGCEGPAPDDIAPVAFNACGGEPFGTWTFKSLDLTHLRHPLATSCPVVVKSAPEKPHFFLQVLDGGDGWWNVSGLTVAMEGMFACLDKLCRDGEKACGLCEADAAAQSDVFALGEANIFAFQWTRQGGSLDLSVDQRMASLGFCVDGDTMTVDLGAGWQVQLQRALTYGKAAPCRERPIDACERPGLPNECHVGACSREKPECPDTRTEAMCTTHQGCAWEPTVCYGQGVEQCKPWEYGVIRGCEITTSASVCIGQSEAGQPDCSTLNDANCLTVPGCSFAPPQ